MHDVAQAKKKTKEVFPPQPTPRKEDQKLVRKAESSFAWDLLLAAEDLQMESGEYFLNETWWPIDRLTCWDCQQQESLP